MHPRRYPGLLLVALLALVVQAAGTWISARHQASALVAGTTLALCLSHPEQGSGYPDHPTGHGKHCPLCASGGNPALVSMALALRFPPASSAAVSEHPSTEPSHFPARHAPARAPPAPVV